MTKHALLALLLLAALPAQASSTAPQTALAAPGLVEPASEERTIGSELIGTLSDVLVDENDTVKKGQTIAIIKNDEQLARLAEAKANVGVAEAGLRLAEQDLTRKATLVRQQNASQADHDRAQAERDAAVARLDLAKAQQDLAQANYNKTLITTPIDGVILRRFVVAGEAVTNQPPTQIASVGDLTKLRVRAEVDELDIARVQPHQRVTIKADALPELNVGGTVIRVNQRLGGRQVQTDRSSERVDSKVLPVLIELDSGVNLPVGLRVDVFFNAPTQAAEAAR